MKTENYLELNNNNILKQWDEIKVTSEENL